MPMKAMCPECQTQYSVPDTAAGKKVKCKSCEFVFPIPGQKAAARPAPKDPWETDDSDDDIPLLTPTRKAKPKPSDGLPPKIVKPKKKATYIADDEEEDEPKPKKKKKKQPSEMDPRLTFLAIAIGIVVLAGVAGFFEPQIPLWIGILAIAGGGLWQLLMAFEEDDFTGWLHLRVPGYAIYFALTRISQTWPALLVQFLGLVLCFSSLVIEHRQGGGLIGRGFNVANDPDLEDPADQPFINAAKPFAMAMSSGNYAAAFEELSPLARANAYRDQFVPAEGQQKQRTSVAPLTLESFKELTAESEKVLGKPKSVLGLHVESRDPEVLAGRGDSDEREFVMGATPKEIPASIRRASVWCMVACKLPNSPVGGDDDDEPYFDMRIIVTEEDGKLGVGYFELRPAFD